MKILWITYAPLGKAGEIIENAKSQSGTWIDATAKMFLNNSNVKLAIACIASKNVKISDEEMNIDYYGVAGVKRVMGKKPDAADALAWKKIIQDFSPNLIMVWGTEYANGLSILDVAGNIPVLFFVQGVVGRIAQYPLGGLSKKEVVKEIGLTNGIKFVYFIRNSCRIYKQKEIEIEMVKKSNGIITDSQWADSYYQASIEGVKTYHFPLPMKQEFLDGKYNLAAIQKHTIFTIDGCNPAKGMFQLIKAISIVRRIYPDVKLLIPGRTPSKKPEFIFESPYYTYLKKLIKQKGLENNVVFLGQQTSEQMKNNLLSCHIFVMPSAIENHSSSLREAMYLGVPSVTTLVGSVDEFTKYGENALTYRYGEEDVLAANIIKLFSDDDFATRLGEKAYDAIRNKYPQTDLGERLLNIYSEVVNA